MNNITIVTYKETKLPIIFNMAAFLKFCKLTGTKTISQAQEKVMQASTNLDVAENFEITAQMYWCGASEGARLQGTPFTLTPEDFLELDMLNAIGQAYSEQTVPEYSADKKTPRKKNGKASPNA
jgi:hypothetical protein